MTSVGPPPGPFRAGREWTRDDIEALVNDRAPESQGLEFKQASYFESGEDKAPAKNQHKRRELPKDIAAMANSIGGVLILGVAEAEGRAEHVEPLTVRDADTEERWMRQTLTSWLTSVPTFTVTAVDVGAGYVLVLEIPPSPNAPHAVSPPGDASQSLSYPIRRGTTTAYLTEPEVAAAYRQRLAGREERNARTEQVLGAALSAVPATVPSPWLWVLAVPERVLPGRSMRTSVVEELHAWHLKATTEGPWKGPFGHELRLLSRPLPGPGFISLNDGGVAGVTAYGELHVDGRAFVADQLVFPKGDEYPAALSKPGLAERVMLATNYALRYTLQAAGSFGTIDILCGIAWLPNNPEILDYPLQVWTADEGEWRPISYLREVTRPPRGVVTVDSVAAGSLRGRLAASHDVALALMVHFGLSDAAFLADDGQVHPFGRHQGSIRPWARQFGIPVSDDAPRPAGTPTAATVPRM